MQKLNRTRIVNQPASPQMRAPVLPGPRARLAWRLAGALMLTLSVCGCETTKVQKPAWIGINTMLGYPDFDGAFASAKTSPEERDRYFELVSELGSPPVRDLVMCWARVQPGAGAAYDFALSDELVMQARSRNVELLALCWGTPGWATAAGSSAPAFSFDLPAREQEEAFRRFVRAFVERYDFDGSEDMPGLQGPLRAYEFQQEMEDVPPDEYGHWLRIFYETLKAADPAAVVSLGSLRSPGLPLPGDAKLAGAATDSATGPVSSTREVAGDYPRYLEHLLASTSISGEAYPYFDVVSFHSFPDSYPGRRPFEESVACIREALSARGLSRPIWLTEFGCDAPPGTEDQQAARLVAWALRARAGGIERAYIYCLFDYRWASPGRPAECLGLVRDAPSGQELVRKAAFGSIGTLLRELAQRPDVTRRDETIYMLAGEGAVAYVMWQNGEPAQQVEFLTSDWWEIRTLAGDTLKRQGHEVHLTSTPVFVQKIDSPFLEQSPFMHNPLLPTPPDKQEEDKGKS